jgi:hypothetical protein
MTFLGLFAPLAKDYVVAKKQKNNIERFNEANDATDGVAVFLLLFFWAVDLILFIWAIALSFKRNEGFDLGSFLVACCCSPCYIVYAYVVPVKGK